MAAEAPYEAFLRALRVAIRDALLIADDLTVREGEVAYVPSGMEVAARTVDVRGEMRIDGRLVTREVIVRGSLTLLGEIDLSL